MEIRRSLLPTLKKYLNKKILLISGPRQCGKTTLSKMISKDHDYISYDNVKDRLILKEQSWDRSKRYIVFDELHKKDKWKSWLKGIFDSEGIPPGIVVTGSARMDIYKKVGDSMAGRFFSFHLFPLDLKELKKPQKNTEQTMDRLLKYSGFPEPYLEANKTFYKLWEKTHIDTIIRNDLIELESPKHIKKIETLIELLKESIGNPLSSAGLANQLECSPKTVGNWLKWLEELCIIFRVTPYSRNIPKSLKKMSKYYFYNWALAKHKGALLENFVACSLLKENYFRQDTMGEVRGLNYLRTKDKQEIDFVLTKDKRPVSLLESKWSDDNLHKPLETISKNLKDIPKIQLVKELNREKTFKGGFEIRKASKWLAKMPY